MLGPGVYPASVTPMLPDGSVDMPSFARLLAHFKAAGCKGVVLAGTNGEGPSLSAVEKRDMVRAAVPLFPDLEIVAGIATPSLTEAIWVSDQAFKAGAVAGLVMAPGYFREASFEGVASWFEALFSATSLPILVYNFPQRTGIEISASLIERLGRHERMVGLKDSSGQVPNLADYAAALAGSGKRLFVGNEGLLLDALQNGWTGTISGAANCIPAWLVTVIEEFVAGRLESAQVKFEIANRGIQALRGVPQPQTNKAVLHRIGVLPHASVRLPLEALAAEGVLAELEGLL